MNLLDLVDSHLTDQEIAKILERFERQREGYFWPTEASAVYQVAPGVTEVIGGCRRKIFWRWMKVPPTNPVSPRAIRKMVMGKAIEQQELDWYEQAGILAARNFKFQSPQLRISGEVDALAYDPDAGIVGVEVKSFYGYAAEKEVLGNTKNPGFPRIDNLLQVMIYLHITKIPTWRLVYITRTDFRHRQFVVGLTPQGQAIVEDRDADLSTVFQGFTVFDAFDRLNNLYEMIARGTLPPCDFKERYTQTEVEARYKHGLIGKTAYTDWQRNPSAHPIGDWQCSYCTYNSYCRKQQAGQQPS